MVEALRRDNPDYDRNEFNLYVLNQVLERIGMQPRADYETAFEEVKVAVREMP